MCDQFPDRGKRIEDIIIFIYIHSYMLWVIWYHAADVDGYLCEYDEKAKA